MLAPWLDEVMVEQVVWQDASRAMAHDPGREQALVARLRAGRFDAALIFTSFAQSAFPPAYACYLAGIPFRGGQAEDFGGGLLSRTVTPLPAATHQVDRNLHLLEALGVPVTERDLRIAVPEGAASAAAASRPRAPLAVIAPAASCHARTYEADRFADVGRMLRDLGMHVALVGSDRDVEACAAIAAAIPDAESRAGLTTIAELAALIQTADLLVGCHSGPMHLADAVRTPMTILFSGTDLESQWRPRSAPSTLLRRETPCAPCRAFECDRALACLDIPPHEVVASIRTRRPSGRLVRYVRTDHVRSDPQPP